MNLPERLAAFKANFEAGGAPYHAPAWVHEPMRRATAELVASGAAGHALRAGDAAPEFTLQDADGAPVSSRALLAQGPLVVTFYRGFWCPYCNLDLDALQEALPSIAALGARLVAISPQAQANSRKTREDRKLSFPVLSDPANEVAARFGLRFVVPGYLAELYKGAFGLDLEKVNGDPGWTLPMPARYAIAPDGVIAYAEVNPDYTNRPDPSELLPVLAEMQRLMAA